MNEYLEKKIRELLLDTSRCISHYLYLNMNASSREYRTIEMGEELIETQIEYEKNLRKLFNCICCYVDMQQLDKYLVIFNREIAPKISDHQKLYDSDNGFHEEQLTGKLINEIWDFLSPFEFIEADEIDRYLRKSGIIYLEKILKNTDTILKAFGIKPDSEATIYNALKPLINCIFPSSINPKSNFMKTSKQYVPDILIPELSTAVEYKFARDQNKLKNVIDEISIDVKGYTGDSDYRIFYAVFCASGKIWTYEQFNEIWKEKKFPRNWKGFYVSLI